MSAQTEAQLEYFGAAVAKYASPEGDLYALRRVRYPHTPEKNACHGCVARTANSAACRALPSCTPEGVRRTHNLRWVALPPTPEYTDFGDRA
jgi:hypothetical protein